ncbi:alpha/beta-hydrolase [Microthyrium microscopicum]|uniref:Alpha/beta-hydrolase n=1 Tax=Microthyrium microscopicum TaxID=703497 RepID=A0A6A6UFM9_9PEZI|nr:alpha/beta-hydrolase [Microthyrium microscopicum]
MWHHQILLLVALIATVNSQGCKPMPKGVGGTGWTMGPAVPVNPKDVPEGCSDFEVIIARGTSEPNSKTNGKFGSIVGDPIMANLTAIMPNTRGYPVQYPASSNAVADTTTGRIDVINRLTKQSAACPNQKFALIGYSLGAAVIHAAGAKLPKELIPKVLAVVLYGDPMMVSSSGIGKLPDELDNRLLENCSKGDSTCDRAGKCFSPHLDYVQKPWVDRGVKFIEAAFKGTPMPAQKSGTLTLT